MYLHLHLLHDVINSADKQVMAEPLYDQLRTKEQLGYSVSCSPRVTCGVLGFCLTAQSAAYGPAHLYRRVCAFMKSFRGTLVGLRLSVATGHNFFEVLHLCSSLLRKYPFCFIFCAECFVEASKRWREDVQSVVLYSLFLVLEIP